MLIIGAPSPIELWITFASAVIAYALLFRKSKPQQKELTPFQKHLLYKQQAKKKQLLKNQIN